MDFFDSLILIWFIVGPSLFILSGGLIVYLQAYPEWGIRGTMRGWLMLAAGVLALLSYGVPLLYGGVLGRVVLLPLQFVSGIRFLRTGIAMSYRRSVRIALLLLGVATIFFMCLSIYNLYYFLTHFAD